MKVFIGKGKIFGKGVFADKNFKKGEVVIKYSLKLLTEEAFKNLPASEKPFTHTHWGAPYLYSIPERYVNHSFNPNTRADHKNKRDVAIRDIKKGEAITTDARMDDVV